MARTAVLTASVADGAIDPRLWDTTARVVFFPVRHHSPAAARLVRELCTTMRPERVLIEGPSDYNDKLDQLHLPHHLPIAIYSHVRRADGSRRGAFYPFCVYSPEWQAIGAARDVGATLSFIDLPWAAIAADDEPSHRYADGELRRNRYIESLCRQLGVDGFDALWDTLFEIDPRLDVQTYLQRCHQLCAGGRVLDQDMSDVDLRREAFMAAQIRRAMAEARGRILVVSGAFHSSALCAQINATTAAEEEPGTLDDLERGIALTPYSYQRLDGLTGYDAGMPNPGFYHRVWSDRQEGRGSTHHLLLGEVARALRGRGQTASAADLIAAETMARGLATLRGHDEVWRTDLVDGVTGALVKEELEQGCVHPMLAAIHDVFRGSERGQLAEGTALPPLTVEIHGLLEAHDLVPTSRARDLEIDLAAKTDGERSRLLHCLRLLEIDGFELVDGSDLVERDDLSHVWERWRLCWSPEHEASCITAAIYGPSIVEATQARLLERARAVERDAERAALLLLDASLAGLTQLAPALGARLTAIIRTDGDFFTISGALDHLLYLFRYDEALGTAGQAGYGALLGEAFRRALWLLEGLGQPSGRDAALLRGVRLLLETFERCAADLGVDREEVVAVLGRVAQEPTQAPLVRGAAIGALWVLEATDAALVLSALRLFADPTQLGDFLSGLFCLAREVAQRHAELVACLDEVLLSYSDDDFLVALPPLRLAFTYFTPREKHHLARTLLQTTGTPDGAPLAALTVPVELAARVLAFEARLGEALRRFGLRGADPEADR
jgi:hypothetical protein